MLAKAKDVLEKLVANLDTLDPAEVYGRLQVPLAFDDHGQLFLHRPPTSNAVTVLLLPEVLDDPILALLTAVTR